MWILNGSSFLHLSKKMWDWLEFSPMSKVFASGNFSNFSLLCIKAYFSPCIPKEWKVICSSRDRIILLTASPHLFFCCCCYKILLLPYSLLSLKSVRLTWDIHKWVHKVMRLNYFVSPSTQSTSERAYLILVQPTKTINHQVKITQLSGQESKEWLGSVYNLQKVKIEFVSTALCGLFSGAFCLWSTNSEALKKRNSEQKQEWEISVMWESRFRLFLKSDCSTNPFKMESAFWEN